jgi:hypothetical protein
MSFRHGIVAYADSLDCVGVLGGTVDWVKEVFGEASITITIYDIALTLQISCPTRTNVT